MTSSLYKVPYFEPTCSPKHALPRHVFRGVRIQNLTKRNSCFVQEGRNRSNLVPGPFPWPWERGWKQLSTEDAFLLYRFLSCLVSRNVFHVVSVLQSFVCLYIFYFVCVFFVWLIRSLVDPTLPAFIVCGPW